jgi:hypothetical protein
MNLLRSLFAVIFTFTVLSLATMQPILGASTNQTGPAGQPTSSNPSDSLFGVLRASSTVQDFRTQVPESQSACYVERIVHPELANLPCVMTVEFQLGPRTSQPLAPPAGAVVHSTPSPSVPLPVGHNTSSSGWSYGSAQSELCDVTCHLWWSSVNMAYAYNSHNVWAQWVDCSNSGGIGFSVTVTWCGTWNNGGYVPNYLSSGDNINVCAIMQGFPICSGHGQRIDVNIYGNVWFPPVW